MQKADKSPANTTQLSIAPGQRDEQVIHVTQPESVFHVRVDKQAELQLVLWLEDGCAVHRMQVELENEARCTILTVNALPADAALSITQHAECADGATVQWQNVTLGGKEVDHRLVSHMKGSDARSDVDWMFYAKGTEKQTLNVRNVFDGRNGAGEILMRGIAEEKGHTECTGLIDIGLEGGGTNTYLTQEVLMLDSTAKVDAIPSLEIKTNDVKASHSATVARVTEEDLFYFGARGIAPYEARRMFVLGFLGDITKRIPSEEARESIIRLIEEKYS